MGMANVGVIRAEGVVVTSAVSTDEIVIQRIDSSTGQRTPRLITLANLLPSGSSTRIGASTLVAGTVTVANTLVTATTRIFLTTQSLGTVTAPKAIAVTARVNGTSFTITSADNTDTSVIAWMLVDSF